MGMLKEKVKRSWHIPNPKGSSGAKEAEILKECRVWLDSAPVFYRRLEGGGKPMHVGGKLIFTKSENSGMPDLMIISSGRVWFAELKRAGGTLTDVQAGTLRSAATHGALSAVVCSLSGLQDFLSCRPHNTQIAEEFAIPVYF